MSLLKTKLQAILTEKNKLLANNLMVGNTIFDVVGTATSDSNAAPINIRAGNTAYVNGSKITGTLPILKYPTNPSNPSDYDYQFIAATSAKTVTRSNQSYLLGTYQIASEQQPDSWMFEGNRKMKLAIPYDKVRNNGGGITSSKIVSGNTIYGVAGTATALKGQTKTVTPTTGTQTVVPDSNYNGLTQVTVNAVTSSIDQNIIPENIASGVTILGVTGTIEPSVDPGIYIFQSKNDMKNAINDYPYDYLALIAEPELDDGIYKVIFNGLYIKREIDEINESEIYFYNKDSLDLHIYNNIIESYDIFPSPAEPVCSLDMTNYYDVLESIMLSKSYRMPEFGILYNDGPYLYVFHIMENNLDPGRLSSFINTGGKLKYNCVKWSVYNNNFSYMFEIPSGFDELFRNSMVEVFTIRIGNNPSVLNTQSYGYTYEQQYNRIVCNNSFSGVDPTLFPVSVSLDFSNEEFTFEKCPIIYDMNATSNVSIVEFDSTVYTGNKVDAWVEIENKGDVIYDNNEEEIIEEPY